MQKIKNIKQQEYKKKKNNFNWVKRILDILEKINNWKKAGSILDVLGDVVYSEYIDMLKQEEKLKYLWAQIVRN